jgi:hypothetical protein
MTDDVKKSISSAVIRILRPLVKILLRNGIPYGSFCEIAKWVYVDTASRDFAIPGRKQSISRVAIITGLSRKEVKRIQEVPESDDLGASDRYNRVVRVISGWRKDPRFLDVKGNPRDLPLEGEATDFSFLVKTYSGDIPSRAVLDEMLMAGIIDLDKKHVRLLDKGYIIRKGEIGKINILGTDVGDLISTIDHNIVCPSSEAFVQRKALYDNIPEESLSELRKIMSKRAKRFIETMDQVISGYDRDINSSVKGKGRKKAGLGIYYFEGDS